jgi:D-alanyl-D-alanine carboxypeptidase/D-alanyl-D-alanine-endopeptidase (penicillin-binding protein 4)
MLVAKRHGIKVLAFPALLGLAAVPMLARRPLGLLVWGLCFAACQRPSASSNAAVDPSASAVPVPSASATPAPVEATTEEREVGDDGSPSPAANAPVPRRVVTPFDARALERVAGELVSWAKQKKGSHVGAVVLDLASDGALFEASGGEAVNPASNQKVLTAAAVLHGFGPAYRFTTELHATSNDARVDALVLRSDGDPSLDVEGLWRLARAARQQGLRRVGTIYVDQSRFDDQYVPPAFEQQPNEWASFRAPVSAVSLAENTVTLNVLPGKSGEPARFWFEPPGAVNSTGSIETRAKGAGDGVTWKLAPVAPGSATQLLSTVGGGIGEGLGRQRYPRRLDDPRLVPGFALKELLGELGVTVDGEVRLGKTEAKTQLAFLRSEPLSHLLYQVGKYSDNFYAETLLKALGAKTSGQPGSTAAGARAILSWLQRSGIDATGVVVKNGSGLFDANRVSPRVLAETLASAYRDPAIASEMVAQLAVGGVDGTLHKRFGKYAGTRAVRAKTGTLKDVIALSGYVLAPGGREPVVFSLVTSGVPPHEARVRIDAVVEAIADELWRPASRK